MSIFDPNALLDATLDSPTEKRPPLDVGDYTAIIGEISAEKFQGKKDTTKTYTVWNVPLSLEVPIDQQAKVGNQAQLKLQDRIMLDLNDNGTLDNSPGKNNRLRMYREALDMNKPGDSFSARKMTGQPILIHIDHEEYEGQLREKITRVARVM